MGLTDQLLRLYRVDQQVRSLRGRLAAAEDYLAIQSRKLEEHQRRLAEIRSQSRQVAASAGNLDGDARAIDARIAVLREQMNKARTNKEYTTFLTEINTLKSDKDKLESRALEELARVDALEAQAVEISRLADEREKVRAVAQIQLTERRAEVGERLAQLENDRRAAASEVSSDALSEFEALAERNSGEAMAEVEEQDRRRMEYSCGACNMSIPVEKLSALLGRADTISSCPSCRRILYVGSDIREVFEKKLAARP